MSVFDSTNFNDLLGGSLAIHEIQRIERERSQWMDAMAQANSIADQLRGLGGLDIAAVQAAKQIFDAQIAQEESIRKMLDPLAHIRSSLLGDSYIQRMLDDFSKPAVTSEHYVKLFEQVTGANAYMGNLHSAFDNSVTGAREMLTVTAVDSGLQQMMKTFEDVNKQWVVPSALLEAIGPLKVLQEQAGKLSLPVMDWASAATLGQLLGPAGIASQLAALGIDPDGSLNAQFVDQGEGGIGLSRKSLELMTLLSFIFAILIPIYQELSSARSLAATEQKFEVQASALESQRKMIEALTKLVEKALVQESKRQDNRYVVRERLAVIRSKPKHGSTVVGKLFPREVVRPISEDGKWIEIEYYHWLYQDNRRGWALKKYFQRVAQRASDGRSAVDHADARASKPKPLSQLIGAAQGAFENAPQVDSFVRSERDAWDH